MTWASAGLTSHLSISYLLAELFELLVHKLGSPKCVVVGISVCSNIHFIKRIAKWKKGISLIPPPFTTAEIPLAAIWQKTTDKKWKFQILVSTCSWAAAQAGSTNCKIAVRVECDTFTTLPSRILVVSLKELPNEKKKDFSNSSTCYNCPKYALAAIWQKKTD